MSSSGQLVQKRWNCCSILRDDVLSYGDYVEQIMFLLIDSRFYRSGFARTSGLPLSASLRLKIGEQQISS
jgi:hypothetical protein